MASHPSPPPCRNGLPLHRVELAGTRAVDRARGLRRRRAHRAPRGERHGPLPRAPGVQGRREVRRLPQGQRDRRAHGRGAQRLHVARPRRLPHHLPRRGRRRGDRPADRLRRAPEDRRRGARPRARRRDPGDRARQRPAVGRRRAPDRPRRVRRPPARAPGARPGGAPAHVHARRDRRLPRAPVGRARAAARSWSATSTHVPDDAELAELFGRFPSISGQRRRPSPRRRSRPQTLVEERDSNQSHLRMSYRPYDRPARRRASAPR